MFKYDNPEFDYDYDDIEDEAPDALELFAKHGLDETVIELFAKFGGENRETALLKRIFLFDPDFSLVWDTQFRERSPSPAEDFRQSGLILGLLSLSVPSPQVLEDGETYGDVLERWHEVTMQLLEIGRRTGHRGPWLYGWLKYGSDLYDEAGAMRALVWDRVVSKHFNDHPISGEIGKIWLDVLPPSADDLLACSGIGPARVARLEHKLLNVLVGYDWREQVADRKLAIFGGSKRL
jgi:hypothetical protein